MTPTPSQSRPPDAEPVVRQWVIERASAINESLLARLTTVAHDLARGAHLAALGGIDGIEREIARMRSFLLLLS
jgi:hypothetical protein